MEILEIIQKNSLSFPDKLAICAPGTRLNYTDLLKAIDNCADAIGIYDLDVVILKCASRLEAIVIMLACIKLEKPFVPVDWDKPQSQVVELAEILNQDKILTGFNLFFGLLKVESFDVPISGQGVDGLGLPGLMSIMFTSGSTGKPKGVMVPRSAVVNLLYRPTFFELSPQDVFGSYSPLSFDASTFEIFTPLLNGNTLVVLEKMDVLDPTILADKISNNGISCMWLTAGLFNEQVLTGQSLALNQLRNLFVGGDKVSHLAASRFLETADQTRLFNGYGPTENTVFTSVAELTLDMVATSDLVPIGTPVAGVTCQILDDSAHPVEEGEVGRLYVKGKGLSYGYFNNPTENSRSFGAFVAGDDSLYYDTGDYIKKAENGQFYFIGRMDRQVKLNGYRVELSSIEARCIQKAGIPNAHAYLSPAINGLVIVCHEDSGDSKRRNYLERDIRSVLIHHEKPKRVVFQNEWPLTLNDKVDTRTIELRSEKFIKHAEHSSEESEGVKFLVKQLLNVNTVHDNANLFDIGFDSISIMRLQVEIEKQYGVQIGMIDIFEAATLSGLERRINESSVC